MLSQLPAGDMFWHADLFVFSIYSYFFLAFRALGMINLNCLVTFFFFCELASVLKHKRGYNFAATKYRDRQSKRHTTTWTETDRDRDRDGDANKAMYRNKDRNRDKDNDREVVVSVFVSVFVADSVVCLSQQRRQ